MRQWPRAVALLLMLLCTDVSAEGAAPATTTAPAQPQPLRFASAYADGLGLEDVWTDVVEGEIVAEAKSPDLDADALQEPLRLALEAATGCLLNISEVLVQPLQSPAGVQQLTVRHLMLPAPGLVNRTLALLQGGGGAALDTLLWPKVAAECAKAFGCYFAAAGWRIAGERSRSFVRTVLVERPLVWPIGRTATTTTTTATTTPAKGVVKAVASGMSEEKILLTFAEPVALSIRADLQAQLSSLDQDAGATVVAALPLLQRGAFALRDSGLQVVIDITGLVQPETLYVLAIPAESILPRSGRQFPGQSVYFETLTGGGTQVVDPTLAQLTGMGKGAASKPTNVIAGSSELIAFVIACTAGLCALCSCFGWCMMHKILHLINDGDVVVLKKSRTLEHALCLHRTLSSLSVVSICTGEWRPRSSANRSKDLEAPAVQALGAPEPCEEGGRRNSSGSGPRQHSQHSSDLEATVVQAFGVAEHAEDQHRHPLRVAASTQWSSEGARAAAGHEVPATPVSSTRSFRTHSQDLHPLRPRASDHECPSPTLRDPAAASSELAVASSAHDVPPVVTASSSSRSQHSASKQASTPASAVHPSDSQPSKSATPGPPAGAPHASDRQPSKSVLERQPAGQPPLDRQPSRNALGHQPDRHPSGHPPERRHSRHKLDRQPSQSRQPSPQSPLPPSARPADRLSSRHASGPPPPASSSSLSPGAPPRRPSALQAAELSSQGSGGHLPLPAAAYSSERSQGSGGLLQPGPQPTYSRGSSQISQPPSPTSPTRLGRTSKSSRRRVHPEQ